VPSAFSAVIKKKDQSMSNENLFSLFPQKKIRPYDGMSVTAEVWEKAHATHTLGLQSHNLFFHGTGILAGLEVVASDPPDRLVYILPGVAVDALGRVIVLPEAVAYDIGNDMEGPLYLLISYRETLPPSGEGGPGSEPDYVLAQYLVAARPTLPEEPAVELARFVRGDRNSFLVDAADTLRPQPNEIDLRYRRSLRVTAPALIPAAVIYLGSGMDRSAGEGLANLAQSALPAGKYQLVVEDDLPLNPRVLGFAFLCLVGEGKIKLSASQVKGLKGYLEHGGSLLLECAGADAKNAFLELAGQLGIGLTPVERGHPLLQRPNLFAAPPEGFQSAGELLAGEGLVLSTFNYPRAWNGEDQGGVPSRAQIRSALEWGENLLDWVAERQASAVDGA
jgi:hypothetical protein